MGALVQFAFVQIKARDGRESSSSGHRQRGFWQSTSPGSVIPKLGLGTWELRGERCAQMVAHALKLGYRHIDTAQG